MNSISPDCDPISRNDSASNISIQESELSGFKLDSSLSHQKQSTPLNGGFRPMRSAASLFSKSSRRRYPVMENNRLVGQVSRKDIVIAALEMKSQTWRS